MVRYIIISYSNFASFFSALGFSFLSLLFVRWFFAPFFGKNYNEVAVLYNSFSLIFIDKGYVKVQLGWQVNSVRGSSGPNGCWALPAEKM